LASVRHLAAEDLRVVFARHHGFRSRDERGEESVQLLDVHCPAALATLEEVPETVKVGVREPLGLGEHLHGEPSAGSFCFREHSTRHPFLRAGNAFTASPDPAISRHASDATPPVLGAVQEPSPAPAPAPGSPASGTAPERRGRTSPAAASNTPTHSGCRRASHASQAAPTSPLRKTPPECRIHPATRRRRPTGRP